MLACILVFTTNLGDSEYPVVKEKIHRVRETEIFVSQTSCLLWRLSARVSSMFAPSLALMCFVVLLVSFSSLAALRFSSFHFCLYNVTIWTCEYFSVCFAPVNDLWRGRGEVGLSMLILAQESSPMGIAYMCI